MACRRALKSGGVYIVISHAASEFRLAYFDDPELGWAEIKHDALPSEILSISLYVYVLMVVSYTGLDESEGGVHYIYVMKKA